MSDAAGALAALLACALAAGCAAEEAPPREQQTQRAETYPASGASGDCLMLAWQAQASPDKNFDRANDRAQGGAISCATGTTPSQFETALAAIRKAARAGDKAEMLGQLGIPLLYIDAQGNRSELQADRLETVFDEVFTPETVELLGRVRLEDLTVVAGQGAFIELGAVWLVVDQPGGAPRIATVNQQALGEAAEAARRAAATGNTIPAPLDS